MYKLYMLFLATDFNVFMYLFIFIVPLYLPCGACSEHYVHICPWAAVDANVVLA